MKKIAMVLLGLISIILISGCSDNSKKPEEVVIYKYTTAQVYKDMCIKCHGKFGEGVSELDKNV